MSDSKARAEATRERILDSAAVLFRTAGYGAAKIDDIMAGAGSCSHEHSPTNDEALVEERLTACRTFVARELGE